VWRGGSHGEADLLAACYRTSLACADEVRARSVAFAAISTGIYGYPADAAARIAVATVRSTRTDVQRVQFVCFDGRCRAAYEAALTPGTAPLA